MKVRNNEPVKSGTSSWPNSISREVAQANGADQRAFAEVLPEAG